MQLRSDKQNGGTADCSLPHTKKEALRQGLMRRRASMLQGRSGCRPWESGRLGEAGATILKRALFSKYRVVPPRGSKYRRIADREFSGVTKVFNSIEHAVDERQHVLVSQLG